jgi:Fur family ferric uptake transcriptional regulator
MLYQFSLILNKTMANHSTPSRKKDDPAWLTFREFLSANSMRVTNQRFSIFEAAYYADQHYTAEDLLDRAKAKDKSVSRATIYRTLPILIESGLIREVDVGRDYKFYSPNRQNTTFQAQVINLDTDEIVDIDAPFMEWYGKAVAEKLGLEVVSQRLQVSARKKKKDLSGVKSLM